MRKWILLAAFCSTTSIVSLQAQYDDVYYDPDRNQTTTSPSISRQSTSPAMEYDRLETTTQTDGNGNTYITNNYYNDDDFGYNDFYYSSQLRRFYSPGFRYFNYWDPWFSNYYFYDMNPWGWNSCIFNSYSFYNFNSFNSPFMWNNCMNNWGWGWNSWNTWNSFYDPYIWHCNYYHGYNPYFGGFGGGWNQFNNNYWNGYNNGYWNGYYDGLSANNWYNNGWDNNYGMWYPRREMNSMNSNTSYENTNNAINDNRGKEGTTYTSGTEGTINNGTTKPNTVNTNTAIIDKPIEVNINSIPKEGVKIDRSTGTIYTNSATETVITTKPPVSSTTIERPTNTNAAPKPYTGSTTITTTPNTGSSNVAPRNNNVIQYNGTNNNTYGNTTGNEQHSAPNAGSTYSRPNAPVNTQPNVNTNCGKEYYSRPNTNSTTPSYNNGASTTPSYSKPVPNNAPTNTTNSNNYNRAPQNTSPSYNNGTYKAPEYSRPAPSSTPSYNNGSNSRPPQNTNPSPSMNNGGGKGGGNVMSTPRKF